MGRCPLDVSASHYNGQPHRRGSWARRQLWWTFSLTFRSISFMLFLKHLFNSVIRVILDNLRLRECLFKS